MNQTNHRAHWLKNLLAVSVLSASIATPFAASARGGYGGGGGYRGGGGAARPANVQNARSSASNNNVNRNYNTNVNRNVNVNNNVNVNRNVNVHGGYGYGYDSWGHPIATAAAVTATAVAVGTIAASLPSSGCTAVAAGGVSYQRCGSTYYQPSYQGGNVQYVVVNPP